MLDSVCNNYLIDTQLIHFFLWRNIRNFLKLSSILSLPGALIRYCSLFYSSLYHIYHEHFDTSVASTMACPSLPLEQV